MFLPLTPLPLLLNTDKNSHQHHRTQGCSTALNSSFYALLTCICMMYNIYGNQMHSVLLDFPDFNMGFKSKHRESGFSQSSSTNMMIYIYISQLVSLVILVLDFYCLHLYCILLCFVNIMVQITSDDMTFLYTCPDNGNEQ